MRTVRLVHTSDVHVGEDGNATERLVGLTAVVDASIVLAADVLLVAGDLYDNARIPDEAIKDSLAQLSRLNIPVLITPGNHDCLEGPTIYDRIDLTSVPSHVRFLVDPEGATVYLEHLSLGVWARGMVEHTPRNQPLRGYATEPRAFFHVAMAHGHYVNGDHDLGRSSPIHAQDLSNIACDYVALGHWHHSSDVSTVQTPAFYSGSPSSDLGPPSVNLVTLSQHHRAEVRQILLP